jgi:hypothetical protein
MSAHIQNVTIEVFRVTRGNKREPKTLGGGMMMYKRRSVRRKNTINVYITIGVMKTYRITKKLEETQRKL